MELIGYLFNSIFHKNDSKIAKKPAMHFQGFWSNNFRLAHGRDPAGA